MRRIFNRNLDSEDLPNIRRRGKKNKPKDTRFLQQQLVGYRPLLTLRVGLIIIIILEITLVIFGSVLFIAVNAAREHIIDYTDCTQLNATNDVMNYYGVTHGGITSRLLSTNNTSCLYNINLTTTYNGTVQFLYGLNNFYQNMRLYSRSRNDEQLLGKDLNIVEDCQPMKYTNDSHNRQIPIAPCGAVANSLFNDTFMLFLNFNDTKIPVPWTTKGILHDNVRKKYVNPYYPPGTDICEVFANTSKPPSWNKRTCELNDTEGGVAFQNFDFMIWMQTAALPHFRKIYRQLDTANDIFIDGLPIGSYTLKIEYNYPVTDFKGTKRFIIAIQSPVGAKNYFLPMAFLITAVALFFATIFLAVVECCPCAGLDKKLRQVARHF